MNYRVNAGRIAESHWIQDPAQGGGRIIGEVCHFVDLMTFLCASQPIQVFAMATPTVDQHFPDNACLQITFRDGRVGVITYASGGDKAFSKERLEVFAGGKVAILNDLRQLELYSLGRSRKVRSFLRADKGHRAEWRAMIQAVLDGGPAPIPFGEIVSTTEAATFRMMDSLRSGQPENIEPYPDSEKPI
jgi:predicted dehydrogenase